MPRTRKGVFEFANTTAGSIRRRSTACKNNIAGQIDTRVSATGIDQCMMPFMLFPYQQQRDLATSGETFGQLLRIRVNRCWGRCKPPVFAAQKIDRKCKIAAYRHQAA
jgi:hypothetical protein